MGSQQLGDSQQDRVGVADFRGSTSREYILPTCCLVEPILRRNTKATKESTKEDFKKPWVLWWLDIHAMGVCISIIRVVCRCGGCIWYKTGCTSSHNLPRLMGHYHQWN